MNKNITLSDLDRAALTSDMVGVIDIDESLLTNVAGGCNPHTQLCTTPDFSCVPPGYQCP